MTLTKNLVSTFHYLIFLIFQKILCQKIAANYT
nr:MAG TPA: hypothetical protein [Caudoviricetes sp.]